MLVGGPWMDSADGKVLASIYTLRTLRHSGVVWSRWEMKGEPDLGRERGGSDTGR
jgi:hypothetical protein